MFFDLRHDFPADWARSEVAGGDPTVCVGDSTDECLRALGISCPTGKEMMDAAYPQGHPNGVGGAGPQPFIDWVLANVAGVPRIAVIDVPDGATFLRLGERYGSQGLPFFGAFACTRTADIVPMDSPARVATHASPVTRHNSDADQWTIFNIWANTEQILSSAEMAAAFSPGPWLVVFHKSLIPGGASMASAMFRPNDPDLRANLALVRNGNLQMAIFSGGATGARDHGVTVYDLGIPAVAIVAQEWDAEGKDFNIVYQAPDGSLGIIAEPYDGQPGHTYGPYDLKDGAGAPVAADLPKPGPKGDTGSGGPTGPPGHTPTNEEIVSLVNPIVSKALGVASNSVGR